jgi:hypothetical protein
MFTSRDLATTLNRAANQKSAGAATPVVECDVPTAVEGLGLKEFLPKDCQEELDDLCFLQQKNNSLSKTVLTHQACVSCVSKSMKAGRVPGTCTAESEKYCDHQGDREMYLEDKKAVAAGLEKADMADQGYRRRLVAGASKTRKSQLSSGLLDLSECSVDKKFACSDDHRNRIFAKAKVNTTF